MALGVWPLGVASTMRDVAPTWGLCFPSLHPAQIRVVTISSSATGRRTHPFTHTQGQADCCAAVGLGAPASFPSPTFLSFSHTLCRDKLLAVQQSAWAPLHAPRLTSLTLLQTLRRDKLIAVQQSAWAPLLPGYDVSHQGWGAALLGDQRGLMEAYENEQCSEGYEGPLCGACAEGWVRASLGLYTVAGGRWVLH